MKKLNFGGILMFTLLSFLLFADAICILRYKGGRIPYNLKELVLTGVLLWISTLFFNQKKDDDWAGLL